MPNHSTSIDKITASQTWAVRQRVMWPQESLEYVKLPKDDSGIHFGLYMNDELISVISLFIEEGNAQFRKLATETSAQGHGHGTALLSYAMHYLSSQKVHRIWCNARIDKSSFYEKFGLIKTADEFVKNGQHYVIMEQITANN